MKKNEWDTPYVSVIVPVYNDGVRVGICIKKLLTQTYPKDRYEIIVVDNCSTDNTVNIIKSFPVKYLRENNIHSSYAARNKGLQHARGEIIAFTDADCIPNENWLKEGIAGIISQNADLAGGSVRFSYSSKPTGSEIWDSITNMQIEQNIFKRKLAKTANLFVRSYVFNKIGNFPQNVKSGGDVTFTQKATSIGLILIFVPSAEIIHPARKLRALLKKQFRVGLGQPGINSHLAYSRSEHFIKLGYYFIPLSILRLKQSLIDRSLYTTRGMLLRVWSAGCLSRMMTGVGNLAAMLK